MVVPGSTEITQLLILAMLAYSVALPLRCGLLSIAPAAFAGIGAYTSGILAIKAGVPIGVGVLAAAALTAIASAVLAIPLLRVQGIYTAVVTLALVVIATGLEQTLSITGGTLGLADIPYADLRPLIIGLLVSIVLVWVWLDHSSLGQRLDVAGEDPLLAGVLGVNVARLRLIALTISGVIAGVAGALYAHSFYFVDPASFDFFFALVLVVYVVVGGVQHWAGPLLGTVILGGIDLSVPDLGVWSDALAGGVMVAIVVAYPAGIAGGLRRLLRRRSGRRQPTLRAAPQGAA